MDKQREVYLHLRCHNSNRKREFHTGKWKLRPLEAAGCQWREVGTVGAVSSRKLTNRSLLWRPKSQKQKVSEGRTVGQSLQQSKSVPQDDVAGYVSVATGLLPPARIWVMFCTGCLRGCCSRPPLSSSMSGPVSVTTVCSAFLQSQGARGRIRLSARLGRWNRFT